MNKEFIPYEQSLELKKLGFDISCLAWYNAQGKLLSDLTIGYEYSDFLYTKSAGYSNGECLAPTFSQAFRWFREKYKITSEVSIEQYGRGTYKKWMFSVVYLTEDAMYEHSKTTFKSYEEAEFACLKRIIEIVQKQITVADSPPLK